MTEALFPQNETPEQKDIRLNKDIAAFSYVWIMSVPIYFSRKDSPFIQYHSKQGIVLFLLTLPMTFIPVVGTLLMLLIVAGMLLGFMNAANGQRRDVPIAGPLSKGEMTLSDVAQQIMSAGRMLLGAVRHALRKPTPKPDEPKTTNMDKN